MLLSCVCKYVASGCIIKFYIKDQPKMLNVTPDRILTLPLTHSPLAALLPFLFAHYNPQPRTLNTPHQIQTILFAKNRDQLK